MIKPTTFLNIAFLLALYWISFIYQAFLLDIVIAALLSMATSGTHYKLTAQINAIYLKAFHKRKASAQLFASIIMTLALMSILFLPLIYFVYKVASIVNNADFSTIIAHFKLMGAEWLNGANWLPQTIKEQILAYANETHEQEMLSNAMSLIKNFGSEGMKFIANSALILVFYFFANLYGREILLFIRNILPLSINGKQTIFNQISQTMSVVMYSTVFVAILEGIIFAVGAIWIDYDPFFWGIAYAFSSLIPVVGGMVIWAPIALYEISAGHMDNAVFISVYTIIANAIIADTFFKPIIINFINKKFIQKSSNENSSSANSLIIFFAIIAGMSVYGFWGIILGPAATSLFISLLKIYDKLTHEEAEAKEDPCALTP